VTIEMALIGKTNLQGHVRQRGPSLHQDQAMSEPDLGLKGVGRHSDITGKDSKEMEEA